MFFGPWCLGLADLGIKKTGTIQSGIKSCVLQPKKRRRAQPLYWLRENLQLLRDISHLNKEATDEFQLNSAFSLFWVEHFLGLSLDKSQKTLLSKECEALGKEFKLKAFSELAKASINKFEAKKKPTAAKAKKKR